MKHNATIFYVSVLFAVMVPIGETLCKGKTKSDFDALQFRAPYSLGELLHDGFVAVAEKLNTALTPTGSVIHALEDSAHMLEGLSEQYHLMIDKSNIHTVQRDDRDFLQDMIDRIDQMIQTLEGSRSLSSDELRLVHKNLEILSEIKTNLSN